MTQKAVFLDRDGTLVDDPGYLSDPGKVRLLDGVGSALHRLQEAGYLLILVTNQSGIGRGYFTIDDFNQVQHELGRQLADFKVQLTDVFYCPHRPNQDDGDGPGCVCRKPKPGLIHAALKTHQVIPEQSYMVGDKWADIEAGLAAGVSPVLVLTGEGPGSKARAEQEQIPVCAGLEQVADLILT